MIFRPVSFTTILQRVPTVSDTVSCEQSILTYLDDFLPVKLPKTNTMEALIFIQQESLDKLRRTVREFKKMPDEEVTHNFVITKLEILEQDYKEFKEGHKEIIAKASKEKTESYFTDGVYEDFEKLYVRYKTMLKEELEDISDEEYYADKYDDRGRRRSYDSSDSRDSHDSYDSRGNRSKEKTTAKAKATLSVSFNAKSKKSSECKLCLIC